MKNMRAIKKVYFLLGLALATLMVVSCQKEEPVVDQPTDTVQEPEIPASEGYLVMDGDTLKIFAVCVSRSTAAAIDISFSNRPEFLFTITDTEYEPNGNSHSVMFNYNPTRSTSYSGDSYVGTLNVVQEGLVYNLELSGATESCRVKLHYSGVVDDASEPAGRASLTLGQNTAEFDRARVFSYDETYSYITYSSDYDCALKITSLQPLLAGDYSVDNVASNAGSVKVQLIYFGGEYVNVKPSSGTLHVERNGAQFNISLQANTNRGEMNYTYQGTYNRQCVVDF